MSTTSLESTTSLVLFLSLGLPSSWLTLPPFPRQIIVCDDPYRHLQLTYDGETPKSGPASFLELDVDKRVIELSSFSKVRCYSH